MGSKCGVRLRENSEACVTYPCIASALIPLPKLTQSSLLLFSRIREFLDLYPEVRIQLILTNDELDLAMRQADIGIRLRRPAP